MMRFSVFTLGLSRRWNHWAILVVVLPALCVRAAPPSPELDDWNEKAAKLDGTQAGRRAYYKQKAARQEWNCYNYGVNKKTTDGAGDPVRAHPGKGKEWKNPGPALTAQQMCDKTKQRAIDDGMKSIPWNPGDPIPTPGTGQNLVALGAIGGDKDDGADYHWWRKNADGSWSHKRGSTKAKTTYTDNMGMEQPLTDPRDAAQRDGYALCGFMGYSKATPPDVGALALAPACRPLEGHVYVSAMGRSGISLPEITLNSGQIGLLQAHLPVFTPSNEVPAPHWPDVPAGQYAGILVLAGEDGFGPIPPYMRVREGVVEVFHAFPDNRPEVYYFDNGGMEPFLMQLLLNQPVGACCGGEGGCEEADTCTCLDFRAGTYLGHGSTCAAEGQSCPAPPGAPALGGKAAGMMAVILMVFGAGVVRWRRRLPRDGSDGAAGT